MNQMNEIQETKSYQDEIIKVEITQRGKSNARLVAVFVPFFVLCLIILLLIIQSLRLSIYTNKNTELSKKVLIVENDLKNNMGVINEEFIITKFNKIFSQNDVYAFTYDFWSYQLFINDSIVKAEKNDVLLKDGKLKITVAEIQRETSLPKSFVIKGNLTMGDENDSIFNHFNIQDGRFEEKMNKEGLRNIYVLEKDCKQGEVIHLKLSEQLAKRLNLDFRNININIK